MIYNILFEKYGPQGWWPLVEAKELLPKHSGKKPANDKERFEIIVGAILTQNTSWKNVEKAIFALNTKGLLSAEAILKTSHNELAEAIKSAGYYNQKAIKLKAVAEFFKQNKSCFLEQDAKELRERFLEVKGIGKETADSIVLYAFEKPTFVIDAYTKRLAERLNLTKNLDYDSLQSLFESNLPKDYNIYKEYHALIVEHAKRFCNKNPKCEGCPLREICSFCFLR